MQSAWLGDFAQFEGGGASKTADIFLDFRMPVTLAINHKFTGDTNIMGTKQMADIESGLPLGALDIFNKSATQKVAVPILFTNCDLSELLSDNRDQQSGPSGVEIYPHALEDVPMDTRVRKNLSANVEGYYAFSSTNALVQAFSLLSYASQLGREIRVCATQLENDGSISRSGNKIEGILDPALFEQFTSRPVEGAKALFGEIFSEVGVSPRMMVMSFVSPNPSLM